MSAYRFALIGSGWRASFYARIAEKMPERFQLACTWVHDSAKAEKWQQEHGGAILPRPEDALAERPDFVVLALNKQYSLPYILDMLKTDVPLLLETPPAVSVPDLTRVWEAAKARKAPVLVAEQYPDQPRFSAWKKAVDLGMIGAPSNLSISAVHGYHAMALIQAFLDTRGEKACISGAQYSFPVRKTGNRSGMILNGEIHTPPRDRAVIQFAGGKTAFYDFSGEQYHSAIRTSHFSVQGECGEIFDESIRFLNRDGFPVEEHLLRRHLGFGDCNLYQLQGLTLGDQWLYRNPLPQVTLSDDEIAIAMVMLRMGQISRGETAEGQAYSLAQALQDAYLAACMRRAIDMKQCVTTEEMPWLGALRKELLHV